MELAELLVLRFKVNVVFVELGLLQSAFSVFLKVGWDLEIRRASYLLSGTNTMFCKPPRQFSLQACFTNVYARVHITSYVGRPPRDVSAGPAGLALHASGNRAPSASG